MTKDKAEAEAGEKAKATATGGRCGCRVGNTGRLGSPGKLGRPRRGDGPGRHSRQAGQAQHWNARDVFSTFCF